MQSEQNAVFHTSQKRHFSRLFPELSPLSASDDQLWALACRMKEEPTEQNDSKAISNGLSIFSQFLAHDMTFESTSKFKGINEPTSFQNDRSDSGISYVSIWQFERSDLCASNIEFLCLEYTYLNIF